MAGHKLFYIDRDKLQALTVQDIAKREGWTALQNYIGRVKEQDRIIELRWDSCDGQRARSDAYELIENFLDEGKDTEHGKDFLSFIEALVKPKLEVDVDIELDKNRDPNTKGEALICFDLKNT